MMPNMISQFLWPDPHSSPNMDLLLIVPIAAFGGIIVFNYFMRGRWDFRRAVLFGFPLPLAIVYTLVFGRPYLVKGEPLADALSFAFGKLLILAPQTFLLYFLGVLFLFREFIYGREKTSGWLATLLVVVVGHCWTRYFFNGA
jgi:hypothetical protein